MRILFDTHTVLWYALGDKQLSPAAFAEIENSANEHFVSPASHWEIAIKIALGKYRYPGDFLDLWDMVYERFSCLPINQKHTVRLIDLPKHHKDPFDRMLIVRAIEENLTVMGCDKVFDQYGVQRYW